MTLRLRELYWKKKEQGWLGTRVDYAAPDLVAEFSVRSEAGRPGTGQIGRGCD